jgi:hypothetical protein
MKKRPSIIFLLAFGTLWMGLVGAADFFLGRGLCFQTAAVRYPTVTGVIVASAIETRTGSRGPTFAAKVTFRYTVGGIERTSENYAYGVMFTSSRIEAASVVSRYPAGAVALVHYNPTDPNDAVLEAGPRPSTLLWLLFLIPFNIIGLGVWCSLFAAIRERVTGRSHGLKIMESGSRAAIRVVWPRPVLVAGAVMSVVAFLLAAGILFSTFLFPAAMWVVASAILLTVGAGVAVGIGVLCTTPTRFIVVDSQRGTVEVPGGAAHPLRFADILEIRAVEGTGGGARTPAMIVRFTVDNGGRPGDGVDVEVDSEVANDVVAELKRRVGIDAD